MSTRAFELGAVDVTARSGEAVSRPTGASADRVFRGLLLLLRVCVAGGALYWGRDYYATPLQERPFSNLHELLKPSGLFGQADRVAFTNGSSGPQTIPNDQVFVFIGGELPTKFLDSCGVAIDTKFGQP